MTIGHDNRAGGERDSFSHPCHRKRRDEFEYVRKDMASNVVSQDMSMSMSMSLQQLLSTVIRNDAVETRRGVKGKRKVVEEAIVDKATLQKHNRMIKNRESAARSRERKQAYKIELESLVTHLEEENAHLLREEEDRRRQRFNQLMESIIPVEEKRKPKQMLQRVNSAQW